MSDDADHRDARDARDAARFAEAVARTSYGKLVALLAARARDVAAAEDALADAFASALADWPRVGCPRSPEAWLLTVARRRLVDGGRRRVISQASAEHVRRALEELAAHNERAERDGHPGQALPDERLALLCACAHPAIDADIRAPLMLQVVLGLDAAAIASAFLVAPATMGKRLVRAKEKIRVAHIPFELPAREVLPERVDAVLAAIYVAFAEGWGDADGGDVTRRDLREEAMFLARLVVELMPDEPEALGLLACLLHADARRRARRTSTGAYVPLTEQAIAAWDRAAIAEAEALLHRASRRGTIGRYQLEAAVQSAHADRRLGGVDNRREVVALYDALFALTASPVVAINRALALADLEGPAAGLAALPERDARLTEYQPYWAARAQLLAQLGDAAARDAYDLAIGLATDSAVRAFLQARRARLPP